MKKAFISALCIALCLISVGCAKQDKSSNVKDNQSQTTQATEVFTNDEASSTQQNGLAIVEGFYGKTFKVKFNNSNDNVEEYTIYDKMGNIYSNVTIDYNKSIMIEKIASTNEAYEYDLNSIKTED